MLSPSKASSQEALPPILTPTKPRPTESATPSGAASEPTASRPQARATTTPGATRPPNAASALFESTPVPPPPQRQTPNEPDTSRYEQPDKITTTRFHIVQRGETLSSISQQYYGSAHRWQKIVEANKDVITDANKISPGTKLIIPD